MLRPVSRQLLQTPTGWSSPTATTFIRLSTSSSNSSPDWNTRRNRLTKVLPKIDRPKDYAVGAYVTLKGHYDEFTGMPRIEAAQQAVYDIEQSLNETQNQKAPIKLELQRLREQIHNLNHSLQMCKRHDGNYLNLMQQLVDLNQREAAELERYEMVEEESRRRFEEYKAAVMRSYAVERTQTTHFKYFSFIFSSVCGGMTFLALLLKYLTQTAEFKEMQRIMDTNEVQRQEDERRAVEELDQVRILLIAQSRTMDQVLQQQITLGKKSSSSNSSTLYDWVAWACRPFKFWG